MAYDAAPRTGDATGSEPRSGRDVVLVHGPATAAVRAPLVAALGETGTTDVVALSPSGSAHRSRS